MNSAGYLIKEGFRSVKINKLMTVASMGVLICCMLLMGCSVLVSANTTNLLSKIEEQNVIMVFMDDKATQDMTDAVKAEIEQMDYVKEVVFISKDEAWENQLKEMNDSQREFFENYADQSPLPDTLKVVVDDMTGFDSTVENLKKLDHVQNIRENSQLAQKLARVRQAVNIVCIAVVSLLFVVSVFIISNTVRISMFSRKLEISIMKSVGATDGFVRTPFIVEGIVIGLLSAGVAELLVWGIYELAMKELASMLTLFNTGFVPFSSLWWILLIAFVILGVATGVGGSFVSMNKYLKHEGSELNEVA
ncbi:MAG: permease-like cell division protein FtsX [Clostridia bacterium]|nr:permease-like cell division protein FtsX [Clostridia bacterium]